MDTFLRNMIYSKFKIKNVEFTVLDIIFLFGMAITGLMMRISVKSTVTGDFTVFLEPWINELKAGGFGALRGDFYNYNPPYMVILYFIAVSNINPLTGIKLVSCIFDIAMAAGVALIVLELTNSKLRTMFAYAAAWIFPTVVVNSAFWGQCDAIYATFLILSLYCLIKKKSLPSMILFGIAFAFKMQAIFLLPAYIILWSKRKIKIVHFLWLPVIYFISLLPAVLAGKSFGDTIGIYMTQAKEQVYLEMNWPGVYELIGIEPYYDYYGPAAMWFAVGIVMCVMFYLAYKIYKVSDSHMVDIFLYIAMVTVYFLPYMHERYGYVAGMLAIIIGIVNLKKLYIPIIHLIVSYGAYQSCLSDNRMVPFWLYSFMLLFLILDFGIYIYQYVNENSISCEEV
ncbi:glycosyltransferase 87 family protein [Konateibacter massiliensis]|uniref:glycosyltransferase 87 family protein n=1 Tax=Konateibacter massiliensis TaxID=2002841 RepID=UPI000C15A3B4|nr:glycosyltransferase 87 family protein [Konateibacter massiliensis]